MFTLFFTLVFLGGQINKTFADDASGSYDEIVESGSSTTVNSSSSTSQSSATNSKKPVDAHYNVHNTSTIDVTQFSKFTEDRTVGGFAQRILVFFMAILGGVAMLGIIAGGVMIMMGGVSETTMEQGKDLLYYSVIGVVIALLSMVIVTLSQSFFYSLGT